MEKGKGQTLEQTQFDTCELLTADMQKGHITFLRKRIPFSQKVWNQARNVKPVYTAVVWNVIWFCFVCGKQTITLRHIKLGSKQKAFYHSIKATKAIPHCPGAEVRLAGSCYHSCNHRLRWLRTFSSTAAEWVTRARFYCSWHCRECHVTDTVTRPWSWLTIFSLHSMEFHCCLWKKQQQRIFVI